MSPEIYKKDATYLSPNRMFAEISFKYNGKKLKAEVENNAKDLTTRNFEDLDIKANYEDVHFNVENISEQLKRRIADIYFREISKPTVSITAKVKKTTVFNDEEELFPVIRKHQNI